MVYGALVSTATKRSSASPVGGVVPTLFQISHFQIGPSAPAGLALVGGVDRGDVGGAVLILGLLGGPSYLLCWLGGVDGGPARLARASSQHNLYVVRRHERVVLDRVGGERRGPAGLRGGDGGHIGRGQPERDEIGVGVDHEVGLPRLKVGIRTGDVISHLYRLAFMPTPRSAGDSAARTGRSPTATRAVNRHAEDTPREIGGFPG